MTEHTGVVRYHRAEFHDDGRRLAWDVEFTPGGPQYVFTAAEGEAMGLTPPEPAPLVVTCNGHSIELSDEEAATFANHHYRSDPNSSSIPRADAAYKLAGLLRDARQDPQPASDKNAGEAADREAVDGHVKPAGCTSPAPTPGIDFDALPDGTKLRHVRLHDATRIKADGRWWFPASNGALHTAAYPIPGNWEVVYQPAPLSPGECLRGLLAGRDDADELIEYATRQWWFYRLHTSRSCRLMHAVGDAAREVHG